MRRAILEALRAKYEAEIAEADAIANIYLENSVGIGEHPQHLEEVNKQIEKIANAKEKLDVLDEFESNVVPMTTLLLIVVNGSITTFLAIFAPGCTYANG